eukprot:TRINITY_DN1135_c0_g1_i1.p1 TRINITY_DN1135_c0_g1~~TRINITY_DN1135_c0_g1_i1.p1  ORF type:complete len:329 (-),score=67.43 TRINITY_DN1135_c0_g1_i1:95-1000(-)
MTNTIVQDDRVENRSNDEVVNAPSSSSSNRGTQVEPVSLASLNAPQAMAVLATLDEPVPIPQVDAAAAANALASVEDPNPTVKLLTGDQYRNIRKRVFLYGLSFFLREALLGGAIAFFLLTGEFMCLFYSIVNAAFSFSGLTVWILAYRFVSKMNREKLPKKPSSAGDVLAILWVFIQGASGIVWWIPMFVFTAIALKNEPSVVHAFALVFMILLEATAGYNIYALFKMTHSFDVCAARPMPHTLLPPPVSLQAIEIGSMRAPSEAGDIFAMTPMPSFILEKPAADPAELVDRLEAGTGAN